MFRWSYIVPRLLLILAVCLFLRYGVNPLAKYLLISSAQSAIGARVELGNLQASLLEGDLYLADMRVADPNNPSKNILEAKHTLLNIDRDALLHRKYVITEGKLSGLQFDTDRATDGHLAHSEAEENAMAQRLRQHGEQWLDGFLERLETDVRDELETVRVTEELMRRWPAEYEQINKDVTGLQRRIDGLKQVYDEMRVNPLRSVGYYQKRLGEIQQLQQEFARLQSEAKRLRQQTTIDREAIVRAKENDERKIRETLQLDNLSPQRLSEYLLGEDIARQVAGALKWVHRGRAVLDVANAKPDLEGTRSYGVIVPFTQRATPDVLFQSLVFDGKTLHDQQELHFQGKLQDLTTQPETSRSADHAVA